MVKCVATLIYCAFAGYFPHIIPSEPHKNQNRFFFLCIVNILAYVTNGDPVRLCRKRRFPYYIADSDQCDLFYKCKDGQITEELCPDGQVYEPESQACFMIQRVKCGRRKRLREQNIWYSNYFVKQWPQKSCILKESAQGNALCPRLYGRFPIENECFAYSECEQGTPTKVNCPPGKQRCAKIQTRQSNF
jgi:hypothetical protein